MRSTHYILRDKEPVPAELLEWAAWFESADRVVAKTTVDDADVSTVFLGLDHRFSEDGPPLLFETMIFGGPLDQECWRCSTWEEAEKQHAEACAAVRKGRN